MARSSRRTEHRRCLVIERHEWETGAREQQLQIPLEVARRFFGHRAGATNITVRLMDTGGLPIGSAHCSVSRVYKNRTRRINGLPLIGQLPACFIFIQETDTPGTYDFWWQVDMPIVAAAFHPWAQARPSQHRRGRLALIVPAPVRRPVVSL